MRQFFKRLRDFMPARRRHIKEITYALRDLRNAIIDTNGLGRLQLMLHNAHIPTHYYDIFYKMFAHTSMQNRNYNQFANTGGGGNQDVKTYPPICIDCGAHAGLVTDIILFCGGISYAFEPNVFLYNMLQVKYRDNPCVILNQQAVSNRCYKTQFLMDSGGTLSQGNRIVESVDSTKNFFEVDVVDITDIIEKEILPRHKRIYFLKLDVEGAEFDIMDSLLEKQLYKHIDFIACETHERFFSDGNLKIQKLRDLIKKHGANNILLDWI